MHDESIRNMPDDDFIELVGNTQYRAITPADIDRLIAICDSRKAALSAAEAENRRLREVLIKIAQIANGYAKNLHTGGDILYIAREALKEKK